MHFEPLFLSKQWALSFMLGVALLSGACGNGGSNGSTDNPPTALLRGRAVLGPLTGADVRVYECDNLDDAIFTTTTSDADTLAGAGLFDIPQNMLSDDRLYVIAIHGGSDIDADDDGLIDGLPTANQGTLHLVATGSQLKAGSFNANILTDIIYHEVVYMLLANYPRANIQAEIATRAGNLIKADMNGDGKKDLADILKWHPVQDRDKAAKTWSFLEGCTTAILDGESYTDELTAMYRHTVGSVDTQWFADAITVSGSYAYLAEGSVLEVIDISDPSNPARLNLFDMQNVASVGTMAVSAGYISVVDRYGLHMIDANDPDNPVMAGSVETPGYAFEGVVSGNIAYVADTNGLQSIDISDPDHPMIRCAATDFADIAELNMAGDHLVTITDTAIQILDVGDPCNPEIMGLIQGPDEGGYVKMVASGSYVYAAYGGYEVAPGVQIIDISDPSKPTPAGSFSTSDTVRDMVAVGNALYLMYARHIQAIDVGDPANPSIVDYFMTDENADHVALSEPYAYVATDAIWGSGLQIIDIKGPGNQAIVDHVGHPSGITGVVAGGKYAYVTVNEGHTSSLRVIDAADPHDLAVIGGVDMPDRSRNITLSDDHAYVQTDASGLRVVDISDPLAPLPVDTIDTSGRMAIGDGVGCIASWDAGLQVVDLSAPEAPVLVASLGMPDNAVDVAIQGNTAFVADRYAGLQVVDITSPADAYIIGAVGIPGDSDPANVHKVDVSGDYAYVLAAVEYVEDVACSLQIIDVSRPQHPVVVGQVHVPDYWRYSRTNLSLSGDYAYIAHETDGLLLIDIADAARPVLVGTVEIPQSIAISVSDGYVYVGGATGLNVLRAIPTE